MSVTSLEVSASNPIAKDDLDKVLNKLGHTLTPDEEPAYLTLLQALHSSVEAVLNLPDHEPTTDFERFPRENIHFPKQEDNVHGGWAWKCTIKDTKPNDGTLAGKNIVIKDNVAVAGVDCLLGTAVFEGWKPTTDATIVRRILESGGTIIGKAVCENFSLSPSSFSAATGPVHNPFARGYSTGGSSSGCGVLVATGEANMAMGGDQGGSVRSPASWCGLFGLKPTHGLVPYTGIAPLEATIDHTGPMTQTCLDNAILLKAVAGRDELDSRTAGAPLPVNVPNYPAFLLSMKGLDLPLKGYRIGLVKEGFEICDKGGLNDPRVGTKVREAALKWEQLGATVEEVSIPMHTFGSPHGKFPRLLGEMSNRSDFSMVELSKKMQNIRTAKGWEKVAWASKNTILNGAYLWDKHPELYGKAANQVQLLRRTYDEALSRFDVLVMPTTPYLPTTHASPEAGVLEKVSRSLGQTLNTCPFNITGHPSLSMPIGMLPSLDDSSIRFPVGLQITGKHFNEVAIYKAAFAWEERFEWRKN
ncbi:amidase signature enzyme [Rhodocollybia butyracea]|uniref:Amidase signature enzyme n=1 Tax=Rhodocollybia butyracea TaxID=206335 RepID=A0A9P5TXP5_9AGAR|nr:amidase signature enzyme [Rhodocollybia butyracea]